MNAVVIGASRGFGLELTRVLLRAGHKVAAGIAARNAPPALLELQERYVSALLVFPSDVTDEDELARGAKACEDFFGQADSVCVAAGVLLDGDRTRLLLECDTDELRRTLDVNAVGPILAAKKFYPILKKGGRFFTIMSEGVGVKNCGSWIPCYALSKTVATKMSGILNQSVKDADFYSVHPGRMNTDMGRATAQIEPIEAAEGVYRMMSGETEISRDEWYVDYNGKPMDGC